MRKINKSINLKGSKSIDFDPSFCTKIESIMKKSLIKIINRSLYPNPTYATVGSAGADLYANIDQPIMIKRNEIVLVPTGLYIGLPIGVEAQIRSRSGLTLKHGIVVANGVGTIDSDYRGEIKVILHNISKSDYLLMPGEKIAQIVFAEFLQADFTSVEDLNETERGSGGFGHSGK